MANNGSGKQQTGMVRVGKGTMNAINAAKATLRKDIARQKAKADTDVTTTLKKNVESSVKTKPKKETKAQATKKTTKTDSSVKKSKVRTAKPKQTMQRTTRTTKKTITDIGLANVVLQYGDIDVSYEAICEKIKNVWKENGGTRSIKTMDVYVKPEEYKAYYVINAKDTGKIALSVQH